jgi:hypothetical protein
VKKILRYVTRITLCLVGLLIVFWIIAWSYITINKKEIIEQISAELNDRINAEVRIGDLDPGFFHTFPFLSLRLSKVTIRDTQWTRHHHEFLSAEKFFVRVNPLSLLSSKPQINKLIVENGSIYLFTDTTGYSNSYLLKAKKQPTKGGLAPPFDAIELKKIKLHFVNPKKHKVFEIEIRKLSCQIEGVDSITVAEIKTTIFIHELAFNTKKGSYLKEKPLEGKFRLLFGKEQIAFNDILLKIDDHPYRLTGKFLLNPGESAFSLKVKTQSVMYSRAIRLLTDTLQTRLNKFSLSRPLNVSASLEGSMQYRSEPLVNVEWSTASSNVQTSVGNFMKSTFKGDYTNQVNASAPRTDENSRLRFHDFSGEWEGVPLTAPLVEIYDLQNPIITCDIKASFDVKELNEIGGSSSFDLESGRALADLHYRGPFKESDSIKTTIKGFINFNNTTLNYIPRKLRLSGCSGSIRFDGLDVYINDVKAKTRNSDLLINGSVKNFLTIVDKTPKDLVMDWKLSSVNLSLSDFVSNLSKRAVSTPKSRKATFVRTAAKIDRFIDRSAMRLSIDAKKVQYKKFLATNVKAAVLVKNEEWVIDNVTLNHAGGTLSIAGNIKNDGFHNPFTIKGNMRDIDISKVFYTFNNFDIEGISDKNISGKLSADFDISAALDDKANIVPYSTRGLIDLSVKNGGLVNFGPLEKMSVSVLKGRDFSDIRFAELKDRIDINGTELKVNQMEIQSTVLSMYVQGIYDLKKGTDMSILVPLSNLKKRDEDFELVNKGLDSKKGLTVHLRAKTGDDGKIKVTWDPFKRALKKNREK